MCRVSYVCILHPILPYPIIVTFQDRSIVTHFRKGLTSQLNLETTFYFITDQAQPNKNRFQQNPGYPISVPSGSASNLLWWIKSWLQPVQGWQLQRADPYISTKNNQMYLHVQLEYTGGGLTGSKKKDRSASHYSA